MAAIRSFFGVAVVLLGCWLAFFGREWNPPPPLGSISIAPPHLLATEAHLDASAIAAQPEPAPAITNALVSPPAAATNPPAQAPGATPAERTAGFTPTHVVATNGLNLRAGPNSSSAVVRPYPRGTPVAVTETANSWMRVLLEDGTTGWMFGRYLAAHPQTAERG
jgi:uncharacterized protein YgiM (DUF1202 family)